MAKRGRRLWMKLQANGHTVPVYVVRNIGLANEEHAAARMTTDGTIEVRINDNPSLMKAALLHEIMHLSIDVHSQDMKSIIFGPDWDDESPDREEKVISMFESPLYTILAGNGLMKLKSPPKLD